jgi:MFS family permease
MEAGRFSRALTCSVIEGSLATIMTTLLGGVFLTAFALRLGATELEIGLLAATTTLAHVAQLGGAFAIDRLGHRKTICMVATWISRLMWIPILFASFCEPAYRVRYIVALLTISSLFASVGGGAWLSWIKDLVPNEIRLRFLGRRHVFNTALAFAMSVGGGLFIDAWLRRQPDSLMGFVAVFITAMSCGIVGMFILQTIPEAVHVKTEPTSFSQLLGRPWQDRNYRRLIIFYGVWNFSSNLATPFFAVYMLAVLEIPFAVVTLLLTLSSLLGVATARLWTRFGDRFGTRNMVLLGSVADSFCPLLWLFVSPASLWLLVPIHCCGVFSAPVALGPNALSLKLSPAGRSLGYLALFNATTGPLTAGGAIVGGALAGWFATSSAPTAGGLQLIFALSAIMRLGSTLLLLQVAEEQAHPAARVVKILTRAGRRWSRDRRFATGAVSARDRTAA